MKTILIVDDIKVNLKVLEVLLTRNGYAVLSVMSAGKALLLLQDHPCDLIISDIQMPEMDGFQFCRLCKLDEKLRHIPIIFYSATKALDQVRQKALKVGAQAVIRKPADPARLLKTIHTVLVEHASRLKKRQQKGSDADHFLPGMPLFAGQKGFSDRLLETVPGIVWTLDGKGDFVYISPAVERLTGFSVSNIQKMGKSEWLNRIHSVDEKNVRMSFKRLFQENVPLDVVYRFKCLDNRFVWFHEKSGIPYENEAEGCCRVDGFITDISSRMLDQDRRMTFREQDVINIFSKGVSHDLDNLLTGIADYIQLSAMTSATPKDRGRFLANALEISRRGLGLSRHISLLSKKEIPVEKNALFSRVATRVVRSLLEDSGIQYRLDMPKGLLPCRVDTRLMARALESVIVNACEAVAQKNDGLITVTLQNFSIENDPDTRRSIPEINLGSGRYVQAIIQDNGCGMDDELIHRIFYPYYSTKPREMKKGVGLSLAVTRSIVLRHGGEIAVYSRKNHGTKMKIFLPAETEDTWYENHFDRG